jgi:hypothetical protein
VLKRGEQIVDLFTYDGVADCLCSSKLLDILKNIQQAVIALPKPIRRVCYVQVFAFMGW